MPGCQALALSFPLGVNAGARRCLFRPKQVFLSDRPAPGLGTQSGLCCQSTASMTQWILGDPSRCPPKHRVRLDAGRQFPQCWARARAAFWVTVRWPPSCALRCGPTPGSLGVGSESVLVSASGPCLRVSFSFSEVRVLLKGFIGR